MKRFVYFVCAILIPTMCIGATVRSRVPARSVVARAGTSGTATVILPSGWDEKPLMVDETLYNHYENIRFYVNQAGGDYSNRIIRTITNASKGVGAPNLLTLLSNLTNQGLTIDYNRSSFGEDGNLKSGQASNSTYALYTSVCASPDEAGTWAGCMSNGYKCPDGYVNYNDRCISPCATHLYAHADKSCTNVTGNCVAQYCRCDDGYSIIKGECDYVHSGCPEHSHGTTGVSAEQLWWSEWGSCLPATKEVCVEEDGETQCHTEWDEENSYACDMVNTDCACDRGYYPYRIYDGMVAGEYVPLKEECLPPCSGNGQRRNWYGVCECRSGYVVNADGDCVKPGVPTNAKLDSTCTATAVAAGVGPGDCVAVGYRCRGSYYPENGVCIKACSTLTDQKRTADWEVPQLAGYCTGIEASASGTLCGCVAKYCGCPTGAVGYAEGSIRCMRKPTNTTTTMCGYVAGSKENSQCTGGQQNTYMGCYMAGRSCDEDYYSHKETYTRGTGDDAETVEEWSCLKVCGGYDVHIASSEDTMKYNQRCSGTSSTNSGGGLSVSGENCVEQLCGCKSGYRVNVIEDGKNGVPANYNYSLYGKHKVVACVPE